MRGRGFPVPGGLWQGQRWGEGNARVGPSGAKTRNSLGVSGGTAQNPPSCLTVSAFSPPPVLLLGLASAGERGIA